MSKDMYVIITTRKFYNESNNSLKTLIDLHKNDYNVNVAVLESNVLTQVYEDGRPLNNKPPFKFNADVKSFYLNTITNYVQDIMKHINKAIVSKSIEDYYNFLTEEKKNGINTALVIREYIQQTFGAPKYVVLAGDIDQIPSFYVPYYSGYPQYYDVKLRSVTESCYKIGILSDYFYANLSVSDEAVDDPTSLAPWDIIVSRLPASTPEEMEAMCKKFADARKSKKGKEKKSLFISSDEKLFDNGSIYRTYKYINAYKNIKYEIEPDAKIPEQIVSQVLSLDDSTVNDGEYVSLLAKAFKLSSDKNKQKIIENIHPIKKQVESQIPILYPALFELIRICTNAIIDKKSFRGDKTTPTEVVNFFVKELIDILVKFIKILNPANIEEVTAHHILHELLRAVVKTDQFTFSAQYILDNVILSKYLNANIVITEFIKSGEFPLIVYRGDGFFDRWNPSSSTDIWGFNQEQIDEATVDSEPTPIVASITIGGCWLDRHNPLTEYDKENQENIDRKLIDIFKLPYPFFRNDPLGKYWMTKGNALTFLGATRVTNLRFNQVFNDELNTHFMAADDSKLSTVGELVKKTVQTTYTYFKTYRSAQIPVAADGIKMYMLLGDPAAPLPKK